MNKTLKYSMRFSLSANNHSVIDKLKEFLKRRPIRILLSVQPEGFFVMLTIHYQEANFTSVTHKRYKATKWLIKQIAKAIGKNVHQHLIPIKSSTVDLKHVIYQYPKDGNLPDVSAKKISIDKMTEPQLWITLMKNATLLFRAHFKIPSSVTDLRSLVKLILARKQAIQLKIAFNNVKDKNEKPKIIIKLRRICRRVYPAVKQLLAYGYLANYSQNEQKQIIRAILFYGGDYRQSSDEIVPFDYLYPFGSKTGGLLFDPHLEADKLIHIFPFGLRGDSQQHPLTTYIFFSGSFHGIYTTNQDLVSTVINIADPGLNTNQLKTLKHELSVQMIMNTNRYIYPVTDNPNLIAFANGLYNRKNKCLQSFSPKIAITAKLGVRYNPRWKRYYRLTLPFKRCSNLPMGMREWNPRQFIMNLANGNQNRYQTLLQLTLELMMTNYSHHKGFILLGPGGSGKSTYLKVLTNLAGAGNYATVQFEQLDKRFTAASLVNKIADISNETDSEDFQSNTSVLKSVITGDPVSVEAKYRDQYSITFSNITCMQAGNKIFRAPNDRGALARRLIFVQFKNKRIKAHNKPVIRDDYINHKEFCEWLAFSILHDVPMFRTFHLSHEDVEFNIKQAYRSDNILGFIRILVYVFKQTTYRPHAVTKGYVFSWYGSWCKRERMNPKSKRKFLDDFAYDLGKLYPNQRPLIDSGKRITIKDSDANHLDRIAEDDPSNVMPIDQRVGTYRQRGFTYYDIRGYASKSARAFILNPRFWGHNKSNSHKRSNLPSSTKLSELFDTYIDHTEFQSLMNHQNTIKGARHDTIIAQKVFKVLLKHQNEPFSLSHILNKALYQTSGSTKPIIQAMKDVVPHDRKLANVFMFSLL